MLFYGFCVCARKTLRKTKKRSHKQQLMLYHFQVMVVLSESEKEQYDFRHKSDFKL